MLEYRERVWPQRVRRTRGLSHAPPPRASPRSPCDHRPSLHRKKYMLSENNLDLEIALRKIHELAMADGDLGYAYWTKSVSFYCEQPACKSK